MTEPIDGELLMSRAEVARMLGVCKNTIRRMVRERKLTEYRICRNVLRYRREDVENLISKQRRNFAKDDAK